MSISDERERAGCLRQSAPAPCSESSGFFVHIARSMALAAERWLSHHNLATRVQREQVEPAVAERPVNVDVTTEATYDPQGLWQKGSFALRKLYHDSAKPLLVIYTSPSCGPCHVLKPQDPHGLGAVCIVVFQESEPYHDAATNTLAVAAQWQISLTYFFAFTLSMGFFETERSLFTVGVALVAANVVIILTALIMGIAKNRERVQNEGTIHKLRGQLANEKVEDKAKYGE